MILRLTGDFFGEIAVWGVNSFVTNFGKFIRTIIDSCKMQKKPQKEVLFFKMEIEGKKLRICMNFIESDI